jgi:hypothetical protein
MTRVPLKSGGLSKYISSRGTSHVTLSSQIHGCQSYWPGSHEKKAALPFGGERKARNAVMVQTAKMVVPGSMAVMN